LFFAHYSIGDRTSARDDQYFSKTFAPSDLV
jgi:hypothetical protein